MEAETRIGPYGIRRLINRGGQGQVYLGYDYRLQRQVAIKIYRLPSTRGARRQVLSEARKVALLQSPRIVQIYDVVQSSDYLAMVMEYVPGCDLEEFLSSVRPSVASVIAVGTDLAAALASSRQQGLVHGDLKAANVLITAEGRVKLTDFGIARDAEEVTGNTAGSISALAPEQVLGSPLDIRTDLFALGRVLYRMLTGEEPFPDRGEGALKALIEHAPRPVEELCDGADEVPPELITLVGQLLCRDPGARPADTHPVRRMLRIASRQMPLSSAESLMFEARPCFRPESAEDIPLRIPSQLRLRGRSGAEKSGGFGRLREMLPVSPWKSGLAVAILLGFAVPLLTLFGRDAPTAYIEPTRFEVNPSARLPEEITGPYLAGLVRKEIEERMPGLKMAGPVGPRVYHAGLSGDEGAPGETVMPGLRCSELFCVFIVQRQVGEQSDSRQVLLFPEQPLEQWRRQVREAVAGLYQ